MDRKKFFNIIKGIKSVYPNFGVKSQEQAEFWYTMLSDLSYEELSIAVQKHISLNKWPPTVADIREQSMTTKEELLTGSDAWGEVQRVIRRYGSYREKEALESLDPVVRKTVEGIGFKHLCLSESMMVDRAHFLKLYENNLERKKNDSMLSLELKQKVSQERLQARDNLVKELLEGKTI